jgi:hypothetical protein
MTNSHVLEQSRTTSLACGCIVMLLNVDVEPSIANDLALYLTKHKKQVIKELELKIQERTLSVFRIGCDEKNYKILEMLPTTIECIMKELNITKMPANKRVNNLMGVGLVSRKRGSGVVESTEGTKKFLAAISSLMNNALEGGLDNLFQRNGH